MNCNPVSNIIENTFEGIYEEFDEASLFKATDKIIQIIKCNSSIIYDSDYFECQKIRNTLGRLSVYLHRIIDNNEELILESKCVLTKKQALYKIENMLLPLDTIDRINTLIRTKSVSEVSLFELLPIELNLNIVSYFPTRNDHNFCDDTKLRVAISLLKSMFGCNKAFLYEKIFPEWLKYNNIAIKDLNELEPYQPPYIPSFYNPIIKGIFSDTIASKIISITKFSSGAFTRIRNGEWPRPQEILNSEEICAVLPHMQKVECFYMRNASLQDLLRASNPEELNIHSFRAPDHPHFNKIKFLNNLQSLELDCCKVLDEDLKVLNYLSLNRLKINSCHKLTDDFLIPIERMQSIIQLAIEHCRGITDQGLRIIDQMASIRSLTIGALKITDNTIKKIGHLTNLKELFLNRLDITDKGLNFLTNLTPLHTLNLADCPNIALEETKDLHSLSNLKFLDLSGCKITEIGSQKLKSLSRLNSLTLGNTMYSFTFETSEGKQILNKKTFSEIKSLMNLKVLNFYCTSYIDSKQLGQLLNLTSLSFSTSKIFDTDLYNFNNLTNLRRLRLFNCPITDLGIPALSAHLNLRDLDLSMTKISGQAIYLIKWMTQLQRLSLNALPISNDETSYLRRKLRNTEVIWY